MCIQCAHHTLGTCFLPLVVCILQKNQTPQSGASVDKYILMLLDKNIDEGRQKNYSR